MNHRPWINFKELRARLKFEDVLRHYKVEVRRKGNQHQGPCPLPSHDARKSTLSFSANLEQGIFQCFSCGAKGNVLEFAALMQGEDIEDGMALRRIAVELQARFFPEGASTRTKGKAPLSQKQSVEPKNLTVRINAPLDFSLKELEPEHPCLLEMKLTKLAIAHFGLGFCSRGMLKGRIAIPLHDGSGKLVGYAGRIVDDQLIAARSPEYLYPTTRERYGTVYEFRRSLLLYNAHRVSAPVDDLVVVEQFPSVWWLNEHGYRHVVALMGSTCSDEQATQIVSLVKPNGRIWLIPEGHQGGVALVQSLLEKLSPHRFTRWVKINEGVRPTELDATELKFFFTG